MCTLKSELRVEAWDPFSERLLGREAAQKTGKCRRGGRTHECIL